MKPFRFHVESIPFPEEVRDTVRGMTGKRKSGYIILINEDLPHDQYKWTLKHELSHIILGHFDGDEDGETANAAYLRNILEIETEANNRAAQMTDDELAELLKYHIGDEIVI